MRHFRAWNQFQTDGKCTGENALYSDCIIARGDWQGCEIRHDLEPVTELDKKKLYAALPALARMKRVGAVQ
jgi:hypothetical protein